MGDSMGFVHEEWLDGNNRYETLWSWMELQWCKWASIVLMRLRYFLWTGWLFGLKPWGVHGKNYEARLFFPLWNIYGKNIVDGLVFLHWPGYSTMSTALMERALDQIEDVTECWRNKWWMHKEVHSRYLDVMVRLITTLVWVIITSSVLSCVSIEMEYHKKHFT